MTFKSGTFKSATFKSETTVSEQTRLFPDPDPAPTFQIVLDPDPPPDPAPDPPLDPAPDPFPDPGQITFLKNTKKKFTHHSEVFRIGLLYCFHKLLM